jgi:hypothetical protein
MLWLAVFTTVLTFFALRILRAVEVRRRMSRSAGEPLTSGREDDAKLQE